MSVTEVLDLHRRLIQHSGGNPELRCTLEVVPGAYHGFDQIESYAPVSRTFVEAQISALADALDVPR